MAEKFDKESDPEFWLKLGRVILAAFRAGKVPPRDRAKVVAQLRSFAEDATLTPEQREEFAAALRE